MLVKCSDDARFSSILLPVYGRKYCHYHRTTTLIRPYEPPKSGMRNKGGVWPGGGCPPPRVTRTGGASHETALWSVHRLCTDSGASYRPARAGESDRWRAESHPAGETHREDPPVRQRGGYPGATRSGRGATGECQKGVRPYRAQNVDRWRTACVY